MVGHPHVAVEDGAVPGPAGQDVLVPREGAHPRLVPDQRPAAFALLQVPQLNLEAVGMISKHLNNNLLSKHEKMRIASPCYHVGTLRAPNAYLQGT